MDAAVEAFLFLFGIVIVYLVLTEIEDSI